MLCDDLDLEFSRFCDALSAKEKRRNRLVTRRLIKLKRLIMKLKVVLDSAANLPPQAFDRK